MEGIKIELVFRAESHDPNDSEDAAKALCEYLKDLLTKDAERFQIKAEVEYKITMPAKATGRYNRPIPDFAHVMPVAEWNEAVANGSFISDDGSGYWCKDGKESACEIFQTPAEDATHVAWYNK